MPRADFFPALTLPLSLQSFHIMDQYFPDDEEDTGVADAPVDESGAFALSSVQAPAGGFQFVRRHSLLVSFSLSVELTSLPRLQGNMS